MSNAETIIRDIIRDSLAPLMVAREMVAGAYVDECPPIVPGVTHCESCGFSYKSPRRVVTHRNLCTTPERHAA